MLQGALRDAQKARLAQADQIIVELRARLTEKDRRIAELEHQLAAVAYAFTRPLAPRPA